MAVLRNVHRNLHVNGDCFICGKSAEVKPDRDHATGYRQTRLEAHVDGAQNQRERAGLHLSQSLSSHRSTGPR